LSWGVPFPGDSEHVVYVWLDALTNYISALGFGSDQQNLYDRYWPASMHLVGKDILRFHCVYWPAFLMSAGLPLPNQIFGHGWWLRDEAKMSKSLGNVVRPDYLIERFGTDAVRYFLARDMTFGQDASFSDEAFLERFNADLANSLGNTASRTLAMVRKNLDSTIPQPYSDGPLPEAAKEAVTGFLKGMEDLAPNRALESVWRLLSAIDGFIQERQPWALARQGDSARTQLESTLYASMEGLRIASILIEPFMPTIAKALRDQLGAANTATGFGDELEWGRLPGGGQIGAGAPLFPRIDVKAYLAEVSSEPVTPPKRKTTDQEEDGMITIDEFAQVQLKVGIVREAEKVPKSRKLVRIQVDLGEDEMRQLVAGIGEQYEAEDLVGRRIVVVANLKPAKLMGVESRGMLLAATDENGAPFLLSPDGEVAPGAQVR
jgi:methionyl-tRNA synthetase